MIKRVSNDGLTCSRAYNSIGYQSSDCPRWRTENLILPPTRECLRHPLPSGTKEDIERAKRETEIENEIISGVLQELGIEPDEFWGKRSSQAEDCFHVVAEMLRRRKLWVDGGRKSCWTLGAAVDGNDGGGSQMSSEKNRGHVRGRHGEVGALDLDYVPRNQGAALPTHRISDGLVKDEDILGGNVERKPQTDGQKGIGLDRKVGEENKSRGLKMRLGKIRAALDLKRGASALGCDLNQ